jgi:hypothetical protein
MRGHKALSAAVLGAFALLTAARVQASPETYPLDRVRAGQTGYGLTTMSGTKPERFTFEVVSVVHNFLPKQDIILVKSDDKKLEITGFWQGMSGSPLYIEDKLVCAFSYGFRFNKVSLGGCTPIEYMKKEGLSTPRRATVIAGKGGAPAIVKQGAATMSDWKRLAPTVDPQAAMNALGPVHKSWLLSAPLPAPVPKPSDTEQGAMTASVPLAVSGFSAPAFAQLEKLFGDSNLAPMRAGGTGTGAATTTSSSKTAESGPSKFEMGGSIAVELIRGDMSAAATGTVSYIDGNNVLAFGHPMFQTGETYAPVSTSYVHTVIPSAQSAFVLASPMKEIGSLTQDRQSAIAADTNLRTPSIPISISISSGNGKYTDKGTFNVEVLDNKFLTAPIAGAALMNAVQYYLPDRDDVTARVESSVKIKGAPPIEFVDYLYANDGASSVMGAVRGLRVLVPLMMNPYAPVTVERVDVKVDLKFEANYGDVIELKVPTAELIAGQRNLVQVVMNTWDGKDIIDEVPVDVPANLAGSIVTLEVTSGDSAKLDSAPPVDLPSLISAFRKLLPGNVWAATLYPADEGVAVEGTLVKDLPPSAQDKLHPQTHTQRASAYKTLVRTVSPAKRVINGSASMLVRVRAK